MKGCGSLGSKISRVEYVHTPAIGSDIIFILKFVDTEDHTGTQFGRFKVFEASLLFVYIE